MLDIQKLINNKKNNKSHNPREINFIVKSYLNNKINNEDMTLWLKEIFDNGMSINDTIFYFDCAESPFVSSEGIPTTAR